ncbi:MAG: SLOG family protein [Christensenellales bacterium]
MNEQEQGLHSCCFTGHRPEKLKRTEEAIRKGLEEAVLKAVNDGYTTFITGMARGVDIWAGQIVLRLRQNSPTLRLIAALPYPTCDSRWSAGWKKQYAEVLAAADLVQSISPQYSMAAFQKRDEWMVDHAARVIAVYDGAPGGTRNTIKYALKSGVEVVYA